MCEKFLIESEDVNASIAGVAHESTEVIFGLGRLKHAFGSFRTSVQCNLYKERDGKTSQFSLSPFFSLATTILCCQRQRETIRETQS